MPPLPGEERLQTVFADVHYYFIAPTPRPLHHRFDKGSYFYIYHNAARHSTRLEIANNPGTPEQDAFQGSLDGVHVRYSYKFPTLLTLVVDPNEASPNSASSSPAPDPQEWRLASADPRDQGQYKYRLHTLDIYFWTQEDAKGVIETAKRLLRPQQLDILDAPLPSGHVQDNMNPVVQKLENVAITDPAYANGQTRNSQNHPTTLPPPPPPTTANSRHSPASQTASAARPASLKSNDTSSNYAPMAYNPAAPAAPEPIAHREKTPPPADAAEGTGLAAAAYTDHSQAYAGTHPQAYSGVPGQPPQMSGHYGSPPPPHPPPGSGHYGSPPPSSGYASPPAQNFQHTPSVTSTTSSHRTSLTAAHAAPPSSATSPPGRQPSVSQPGYGPPPQDPNAHLYGSVPGTQSNKPFSPPPPPPPPPPQQTGFAPPPPHDPNVHLYGAQPHPHPQHQPSSSIPAESPGTQIYGSPPFTPQPHQPIPHLQPQYADYLQSRPVLQPQPQPQAGGAYPPYPYNPQQPLHQHQHQHQQHPQPQQHHQHHHHHDSAASGNGYNIHGQIYRPTPEEEDKHKHRREQKQQQQQQGQQQQQKPIGRLEDAAGKVDKKVGSFLKRLDKRL